MFPLTLFFYGFLAACAGLLFQVLLMSFWVSDSLTLPTLGIPFIITAACIEEFMKLGFLSQAQRRYGFETLSLLPLFAFGFGFACLEVGMTVLSPNFITWSGPLFPLLSNTLFHISTVLILGFSLKKFGLRHPLLWGVFLGISFLHIFYNLYRAS